MSAEPIDLHWVQARGSKPGGIMRPNTIDEAAFALAENPHLRPIAGGTDLLLELERDGKGGCVDLLDMTGIAGFDSITSDNGAMSIGAGVTHADILASSALDDDGLLVLRQACLEIGSPQLRNRATVAGNLATASPANDTISALVALGAELTLAKAVGSDLVYREVLLEDFYVGLRSTVLESTELITVITIPASEHQRRGIWIKAGLRKAQAISVVHAGIVLEFQADGMVVGARIALGSVGPTVATSTQASQMLVGSVLDVETIAAAAQAAVDSVSPIDDGRATAAYRRSCVSTVVSRGLSALASEQEAVRWPTRVPLLSNRKRSSRTETDRNQADRGERRTVTAGQEVSVTVNGAARSGAPVGSGTLLDWLRETTGTGTKEGCAEGECGACTVVMDDDAVMSCLVPAVQADGSSVTTVEGLAASGEPSPMQQSFIDAFAVQCGYCIPGFVVAAQTLADELRALSSEPHAGPTREEVELALSGNLCRCTGYYNIIDAVVNLIQGDLIQGDLIQGDLTVGESA